MPRLSRRKHTNSKLGCLNCKRKNIRCDEVLPQCGNCARAKKETCSYLLLSQSEINRIRLTHSLRNSQNKLLPRKFRLPTSTQNLFDEKDVAAPKDLSAPPDSLEFKFEHCHFKTPFVSGPYLSLQFHNTFIGTYNSDYRLEDDHSGSESVEDPLSKLPNCTPSGRSFPRLRYKSIVDSTTYSKTTPFTKGLLGYFFSKDYPDVFLYLHCFGAVIILNRIKLDLPLRSAHASPRVLSKLESRVNELQSLVRQVLPHAIDLFANHLDEKYPHLSASEKNTGRVLLVMITWTIACALSMLNFSREVLFKIFVSGTFLFKKYVEECAELKLSKEGKSWLTVFQNKIVFIHLHSYEPAFMYEVHSNLHNLSQILDSFDSIAALPAEIRDFKCLRRYQSLVLDFLDTSVLDIMFKARNEHFVTTYPPTLMYNSVRKWWSLLSLEIDCSSDNRILANITRTLHLYRLAVSVALDSVFPATKYLFAFSFEDRRYQCAPDIRKESPEPLSLGENNPYLAQLFYRHNIYAIRLYSFFKKRVDLFVKNMIWKGAFSVPELMNRFSSRPVKNVLEIPIRQFNTVAIGPSHYAKKIHGHYESILKDPSTLAVYTRPDSDDDKNWAPQPFSLFDMNREIKMQETNSFCVEDYVPTISCLAAQPDDLSTFELSKFLHDRTCILQGIT